MEATRSPTAEAQEATRLLSVELVSLPAEGWKTNKAGSGIKTGRNTKMTINSGLLLVNNQLENSCFDKVQSPKTLNL